MLQKKTSQIVYFLQKKTDLQFYLSDTLQQRSPFTHEESILSCTILKKGRAIPKPFVKRR